MDPLADKLTQISVLATLMIKELIPVWILAIVIAKEAVMIAGASFLYGRDVVVSSKWFGKLATVLFFIAIVCSCFISYWNMSIDVNNPLPDFAQYIYYLALFSSIFSLVMYFLTFSKKGYIKIYPLYFRRFEDRCLRLFKHGLFNLLLCLIGSSQSTDYCSNLQRSQHSSFIRITRFQ